MRFDALVALMENIFELICTAEGPEASLKMLMNKQNSTVKMMKDSIIFLMTEIFVEKQKTLELPNNIVELLFIHSEKDVCFQTRILFCFIKNYISIDGTLPLFSFFKFK